VVPSRLVGAKTQVPLKLKGRDPLLRGAHQAKRDHPLVKGDVAILEDRADRDRELLAAGSRVAREETRTGAVAVESSYGGLAAVGADGAIGPADRFQQGSGIVFAQPRQVGQGQLAECLRARIPQLW